MRMMILLLLGCMAAPAAAHDWDYGHRRGYGNFTYRSHYGQRWHNYYNRIASFRAHPWRVHRRGYYGASYGYHHGHYRRPYGHGYRYTYYANRHYRRYGNYGVYGAYRVGCGYGYSPYYYRPVLSIAPFYTRFTTVFTLEDSAFDGPRAKTEAPSFDGLPKTRLRPVGSRFLVSAK